MLSAAAKRADFNFIFGPILILFLRALLTLRGAVWIIGASMSKPDTSESSRGGYIIYGEAKLAMIHVAVTSSIEYSYVIRRALTNQRRQDVHHTYKTRGKKRTASAFPGLTPNPNLNH